MATSRRGFRSSVGGGGGVDPVYSNSNNNSQNFASQSAPLSIGNLMMLRDKFDELVSRLRQETRARKDLEQQLADERCFRTELARAQVRQQQQQQQQGGAGLDDRSRQLAKQVSNLRLKLRQAEQRVDELEYAAVVNDVSGTRPQHHHHHHHRHRRRQNGRAKADGEGDDAVAALAFHNQKLKTRVADLTSKLKSANTIAEEKSEAFTEQTKRVSLLERRLDDLTLDNDRLLEKSKSLLGKYRRSLSQMRELQVKVSEADLRAKKADAHSAGLTQRMATLRRRNQSLQRTIDEGQLELKQTRFAHERNEEKHQQVLANVHTKLDTVVSKNRALLESLNAVRDENSILENQNQRLRRRIAEASSSHGSGSPSGREEVDDTDHVTDTETSISQQEDTSNFQDQHAKEDSRSKDSRSISSAHPNHPVPDGSAGVGEPENSSTRSVAASTDGDDIVNPRAPSPKLPMGVLYHLRPDSPFDAQLPEVSVSDSEQNSSSARSPSLSASGHPTSIGAVRETVEDDEDDVLLEAAASELADTGDDSDYEEKSTANDERPSKPGHLSSSIARTNFTRQVAESGFSVKSTSDGGHDDSDRSEASDEPPSWGGHSSIAAPDGDDEFGVGDGGSNVGSHNGAARLSLQAIEAEERTIEEEFDVYNQE